MSPHHTDRWRLPNHDVINVLSPSLVGRIYTVFMDSGDKMLIANSTTSFVTGLSVYLAALYYKKPHEKLNWTNDKKGVSRRYKRENDKLKGAATICLLFISWTRLVHCSMPNWQFAQHQLFNAHTEKDETDSFFFSKCLMYQTTYILRFNNLNI